MNYNRHYYLLNIDKYRKGGKYYRYKPKQHKSDLKIKTGLFLVYFN